MPYNSLISRSEADALIPVEYADQIVTATLQESATMRLCRRVNMASGQQRVPVLSVLPQAYWVQGDTGLKQTTEAAWQGVFLNAEEIAVIVPVQEAVIMDATFDIFGELKGPIGQAVAAKIDAAVFSGVEIPGTWPQAIIPAAVAAGNVVTQGTNTPDKGGVIGDLADVLSAVEADGYEPGGFAASRSLRPLLRGARSTTGESLAPGDSFNLNEVWGLPIAYAVAWAPSATVWGSSPTRRMWRSGPSAAGR